MRVSERWGTVLVAVFFIVLGIVMYLGSLDFPRATGSMTLGPGYVPRLLSVALVGLSLLTAAAAVLRKTDRVIGIPNASGLLLTLAATVIYVLMVPRLGYFSSTLLFTVGMLTYLNRRAALSVAVGAGLTLAVYILFSVMLGVRFPGGLLG